MKIFVTGGAGFIGSATVNSLIQKGHQVTVYDNLSTGYRDSIEPKAKFILGDIRDRDLLVKSMMGHDLIMHFAAKTEAGESVNNPENFYQVNIMGGINLLEAARKLKINKIVFSSSAAIYEPQSKPVTENSPKGPVNPYGATKLIFEDLLSAYYHSYNIESISLRYFNVYGPGAKNKNTTLVIPNFIKSIIQEKPVLLYWQGQQIRDFIYIDDLVKAHILALDFKGLKAYNLGSGKGTKIIDLLKLISNVIGKKANINDLGERKGDPSCLVSAYKKAARQLNWEPQTTLEVGLKKTVKYYQDELKKA